MKSIDKKSIALVVIIILSATASFALGRLSVREKYRDTNAAQVIVPVLPDLSIDTSRFAFIASKSGTRYYPKGCKSVNRIKPENRIFFETAAEAEETGFTKAAGC